MRLDGAGHDRTYLTPDELRSGREPAFTVGTEPSGWGTGDRAAPPPVGSSSATQQQSGRQR
ncbi:hypothetical protein [Streptomyces sp. 2112.3]|uniref:hypothetical protein n=1 Tax=unclassified Streptomyces TaxID=2593676 RepID=UPI0035238A53